MKEGIMIIGHGSKLSFNKHIMELHAGRLREKGFENIYIGFNETSFPSIEYTLEKMAADGIDMIYAVPLFIASGIHLTRDVPGKLRIPESSSGGTVDVNGRKVTVKYASPIGDDPRITDILEEKISGLK